MRAFIIILSLFVLGSCSNNSGSSKTEDTTNIQKAFIDTNSLNNQQDTTQHSKINSFALHTDIDRNNKKKNLDLKKERVNVDNVIKEFNHMYPDIKLEKIKLSGDTLYSEINDNKNIGGRMRTDTAALYLAKTIINLTSVKDVKYVHINFDENGHTSPGVWSREDFKDYKKIK